MFLSASTSTQYYCLYSIRKHTEYYNFKHCTYLHTYRQCAARLYILFIYLFIYNIYSILEYVVSELQEVRLLQVLDAGRTEPSLLLQHRGSLTTIHWGGTVLPAYGRSMFSFRPEYPRLGVWSPVLVRLGRDQIIWNKARSNLLLWVLVIDWGVNRPPEYQYIQANDQLCTYLTIGNVLTKIILIA